MESTESLSRIVSLALPCDIDDFYREEAKAEMTSKSALMRKVLLDAKNAKNVRDPGQKHNQESK